MSEATKAAPIKHPLVQLVVDATALLEAYLMPTGPSKADTIAALCKLLDSQQQRDAFAAQEATIEALKRAKDRFQVLRNESGVKEIDAALAIAGAL